MMAVGCAAAGVACLVLPAWSVVLLLCQIMWSLGPTYLLCSSVVMTALVAYMDHFDMSPDEEDTAREAELQQLMQPASGPAVAADRSAGASASGAMLAATGGARGGLNAAASATPGRAPPAQSAADAGVPVAADASNSHEFQSFATNLMPDEPPRHSRGSAAAAAAPLQRQASAAQVALLVQHLEKSALLTAKREILLLTLAAGHRQQEDMLPTCDGARGRLPLEDAVVNHMLAHFNKPCSPLCWSLLYLLLLKPACCCLWMLLQSILPSLLSAAWNLFLHCFSLQRIENEYVASMV